jgi:putative acetyltransferase
MTETEASLDPSALATRAGVRIRAAEPDDIGAIHAMMLEGSVYSNTLQVPHTSLELRRERLKFADPHGIFIAAESLDGGDVVGNAGIHRNLRPRRIHSADLGMSVCESWQGRGVGSALMAALLDIADNWWQVRRVQLEVYADNEPAVALYRKFGFEVEGTMRGDSFRDGQYVDSHVMARVRNL